MRIDNTVRSKITTLAKISKISTINININSKQEGKAKITIAKHKTAKTLNINIGMSTKHKKEANTTATNFREILTKAGIQYNTQIIFHILDSRDNQ